MPPAPCFLWNGGYEAKWLRKSGSLAWIGACEMLVKTKKGSTRSDQSWGPGGLKAKLENKAKMDPMLPKGCPGGLQATIGRRKRF